MATKYPILHTGCIPNEAFTFITVTNQNMKIDGNPVITSFTWKSKEDPESTGTVNGNSISTKIDGVSVIIINPAVAAYYTPPLNPTVLSD